MKIKKHFNTKKNILIATLAVIVLAGGAYSICSYISHNQKDQPSSQNSKNTTYTPPTPEQVQAGDNQKQQALNNDQATQTKPVSLQVTISAASQSGSILSVRSLIQYITNTGTCTLTLSNNQSVVTKTSSIEALASTSTCKGFDIDVSTLTSGTWHIKVTVTSGTLTGSVEKDVVIN